MSDSLLSNWQKGSRGLLEICIQYVSQMTEKNRE